MSENSAFNLDPESVLAKVARLRDGARRRHEEMAGLRRRIETISVTERSADGSVEVTVGHTGRLTKLVLTDRSRRRNPAALAGLVMHCVERASARIADQVERAVSDAPAGQENVVNAIVQRYRDLFSAPADSTDLTDSTDSATSNDSGTVEPA